MPNFTVFCPPLRSIPTPRHRQLGALLLVFAALTFAGCNSASSDGENLPIDSDHDTHSHQDTHSPRDIGLPEDISTPDDIQAPDDTRSPQDIALPDDISASDDTRAPDDTESPPDSASPRDGLTRQDVHIPTQDIFDPNPAEDARSDADTRSPNDAITSLDAVTPSIPPPSGTTLLYRVDFEDGTINASPGQSNAETSAVDNGGGQVTNVANPVKDAQNSSDRVGKHQVPAGYRRAELSSQRLPTDGQTYIYKWSYLLPDDYFDAPIDWNIIGQWKTWPCGKSDSHPDQICGPGGIFNEVGAYPDFFNFRYRAEPACYEARPALETGRWVNYVQEIHWSNADDGYVKLWKDGSLIYNRRNFKTLFDDFEPGRCDMYWAVGIYAESDQGLQLYTDNIEIWLP